MKEPKINEDLKFIVEVSLMIIAIVIAIIK